jgi:hypothetical protein
MIEQRRARLEADRPGRAIDLDENIVGQIVDAASGIMRCASSATPDAKARAVNHAIGIGWNIRE